MIIFMDLAMSQVKYFLKYKKKNIKTSQMCFLKVKKQKQKIMNTGPFNETFLAIELVTYQITCSFFKYQDNDLLNQPESTLINL